MVALQKAGCLQIWILGTAHYLSVRSREGGGWGGGLNYDPSNKFWMTPPPPPNKI